MIPSEHQNLESLLKQMQLRTPSTKLDDSILQMVSDSKRELTSRKETEPGRLGWGPLVATAIVAALGGLLIGSAYPLNALEDAHSRSFQQETAAHALDDQADRLVASQITPVKFNLQAYEMLHGHSTNSTYANCGTCHQTGQDEAFEGWFYGNDDFFQKHSAGQLGKCSSCHEVAAQNRQEQQDAFQKAKQLNGFKHSDFPDANCASCHGRVAGVEVVKPSAKLLKEPFYRQTPFQHHFEGMENCSNCHVGGERNPDEQQPGPDQNRGYQHGSASDCTKCHLVESDLPASSDSEFDCWIVVDATNSFRRLDLGSCG